MSNIVKVEDSATISTTEYDLVQDAAYSAGTLAAGPAYVVIEIDADALLITDTFTLRYRADVNGDVAIVNEWVLQGPYTDHVRIDLGLVADYAITLIRTTGADRSIGWKLITDGGPLTAGETAGAVWNALRASYVVANSFGEGVLLAANAVSATAIATGAVTAAKFAAGAIDASAIATGAITAAKFAASAIDASAIASSAISAAKIASGAITSAKFAAGAIDATAIATDAIGAAQLAAGGVAKILAAYTTWIPDTLGGAVTLQGLMAALQSYLGGAWVDTDTGTAIGYAADGTTIRIQKVHDPVAGTITQAVTFRVN